MDITKISLKELIELYPVSYKKGCRIYFLFNYVYVLLYDVTNKYII